MKDLVVECYDEFGHGEVREMSFEELKELSKDCYSISSLGMYDNENKAYIVLIINGELNKGLIPYASHNSCEILIDKYHINKNIIYDIQRDFIKKSESYPL